MSLFNVTALGVADPFEWSTRVHPKPTADLESGKSSTDNLASPRRHSAESDGQSGTGASPASTWHSQSSSARSRRLSAPGSPRTRLISARRTQPPRSTRSALQRAGQVPDGEGLILPPVPGAMPPIPSHVRGNTALHPRASQVKPAHSGSHQKFLELRTKHRYNPHGPNDLYAPQMTTTHDYGRWLRTCQPADERWVLEQRRGIAASEITKFVDDMSKTNKDFRLF